MTTRPASRAVGRWSPRAAWLAGLAAALLVVASLPGCSLLRPGGTGPSSAGRISGRLVADRVPPDAVVEVYRDDHGRSVPVPGVTARPDELGKFETPSLPPGRYVLVLRTREAPPALASATVPGRAEIELRPVSPGGGATVTFVRPDAANPPLVCRLTPVRTAPPVPDRREAVLGAGGEVRLSGLVPGLWHVEVSPPGVTADFLVPSDDTVPRFLVDPGAFPPAASDGGWIEGQVLHDDGRPAAGTVVTVRACANDGLTIEPWGRVAIVGADGSYRMDRVRPGVVYVRVEARGVHHPVLPQPVLAAISPSRGTIQGFVVRP